MPGNQITVHELKSHRYVILGPADLTATTLADTDTFAAFNEVQMRILQRQCLDFIKRDIPLMRRLPSWTLLAE
ncbi:hypothetical protein HAD_07765 [Hyphomonas adhaerens MHS-3]|uniref:Uncharacterized protein n=1 Tax=Hyphomonas adhaerens MHS-3 TaxID=1280949 RepID=A0A069E6F9_9PROT|nr:hypothetical protein HAD_07765 [Hyphomonas adhaerens MHS-3]